MPGVSGTRPSRDQAPPCWLVGPEVPGEGRGATGGPLAAKKERGCKIGGPVSAGKSRWTYESLCPGIRGQGRPGGGQGRPGGGRRGKVAVNKRPYALVCSVSPATSLVFFM